MQPTYLLHLSDGSISNGLVSHSEHDAAIRLNLLVFEYLAISAPGLLRNHFLYDTISGSQEDRDGLEQAYRKGLIRPIVFSENDTDSESGEKNTDRDLLMRVAETIMANHESPVGLSDPTRKDAVDLLEDHAGKVCGADAQCVRVSFCREQYLQHLQSVVEEALLTSPNDECLARFAREIEREDASAFRVIDAYKIAEKMAREGIPGCCRLKALAFIAMDWLTHPKVMSQFAVPRKAAQFTDLCTRVWSRGLAEPKQADGVRELAEIDIPPDAIARLTLGEAIAARETDLIKEIQKTVASFRKQPDVEPGPPEVDKWNDLAHGFRRWLGQETRMGRTGYLEKWGRSQENRKKMWLAWLTSAARPINILVSAGLGVGVTSVLKHFNPEWHSAEIGTAAGSVAGAVTWLIITRVVSGGATGEADSTVYQVPPPTSPGNLKWRPVSNEILYGGAG